MAGRRGHEEEPRPTGVSLFHLPNVVVDLLDRIQKLVALGKLLARRLDIVGPQDVAELRPVGAHPAIGLGGGVLSDVLVSVHEGVRLTYAELGALVDRCARGLLALGIEREDRVGIWAPNRHEWAVLQYATAKVGAILVNINPAYRTHEVAYVLEQAGCRMLVAASTFKTSDYVGMNVSVAIKKGAGVAAAPGN